MDRIIGNLSIYDVLSMVIPGGTFFVPPGIICC